MTVPQKRKKAEIINATRAWLQIYSIVLDSIKDAVPVEIAHSISTSAANAILKEVEIND